MGVAIISECRYNLGQFIDPTDQHNQRWHKYCDERRPDAADCNSLTGRVRVPHIGCRTERPCPATRQRINEQVKR